MLLAASCLINLFKSPDTATIEPVVKVSSIIVIGERVFGFDIGNTFISSPPYNI